MKKTDKEINARSRNMAAIRGKDTKPEIKVRKLLHSMASDIDFIERNYQDYQILFYQDIKQSSLSMVVSSTDIMDVNLLLPLKPGKIFGNASLKRILKEIKIIK